MRGGPELSTEDSYEPTCSTTSIELSSVKEEARVLLVPTREGTSKGGGGDDGG